MGNTLSGAALTGEQGSTVLQSVTVMFHGFFCSLTKESHESSCFWLVQISEIASTDMLWLLLQKSYFLL